MPPTLRSRGEDAPGERPLSDSFKSKKSRRSEKSAQQNYKFTNACIVQNNLNVSFLSAFVNKTDKAAEV